MQRIPRDVYQGTDHRLFHRDRRILLYALTWPAQWLHAHGLQAAPERYTDLIEQRLDEIVAHGDPNRYRGYFPRYLLKVLQDWFQYHGHTLYEELTLLRSQMERIDLLITKLNEEDTSRQAANNVEALAHVHRILHAQRT